MVNPEKKEVLAMTKQAMQKAQFTLEVLQTLLSIRDIPKADNAKWKLACIHPVTL